nr:MBL fold metallo-hydrolase [Geodermatophilaceae bacterium]
MLKVEIIATEELGDRTYIAHDGALAVVVDPQRDLDRVEAVLRGLQLRVGAVLETHIHNDYVTGGFELAGRTGAEYVLSAADEVAFERRPVRHDQELTVGTMVVRALSTPGHTDTHMSYVVSDAGDPGAVPVVFTGGSLLYGSVGRTDLISSARTEELTRAQYHSARSLVAALPEATAVYPTHGFGSFCSAGSTTGADASTIGTERRGNDALVEDDEDAFVKRLIAGLTAYPAYYAHMGRLNREGPAGVDLSPVTRVDPEGLRARIAAGEWVVDLRDRTAYAHQHLHGTIGIALGTQFATFLGWLMPWGSRLTLLGGSPQEVADAQRQLVRIGVDRPSGAVRTSAELAAGGPTCAY